MWVIWMRIFNKITFYIYLLLSAFSLLSSLYILELCKSTYIFVKDVELVYLSFPSIYPVSVFQLFIEADAWWCLQWCCVWNKVIFVINYSQHNDKHSIVYFLVSSKMGFHTLMRHIHVNVICIAGLLKYCVHTFFFPLSEFF